MKVKITETELKAIINESIKKALNELDWKTYANASKKDKDPERRKKFAQTAANSFNKNYGYENDDNKGRMSAELDNSLSLSHNFNDSKGDAHTFVTPSHEVPYDDMPTYHYVQSKHGGKSFGYTKHPFTNNKNQSRKMQKSEDEFNAYRKGGYEYENGKGWNKIKGGALPDHHDYLKY